MHQGCVAGANDGGEGRGGMVADIAKLSVGREAYYTRELATDHEQYLSGHGSPQAAGTALAYLDEHLGVHRGHGGVQHVSGQGC